MDIIGGDFKALEQQKRLQKAQRDLWFLAEQLDVHWLDESYHRPMFRDIDRRRKLRRVGLYDQHEGEMWPRDYKKTTTGQIECVQDFLCNPLDTIMWWHAVEEEAQKAASQVGHWFQHCKELRRLMPEIMPSPRAKKWVSAKGFNFRGNVGNKQPSMMATGAGSEVTGAHARICILDDIIGENDIEDSLMPKKRRWFGRTVMNVMYSRGGELRMKGTHWDTDDIYADWRKSPDWDIRVRGAYETDGVPDWDGQPMHLTKKEIERKRRGMSPFHFSCQMMNDPLPDEERRWDRSIESELFIDDKEAFRHPGRVFVLSDPAPRGIAPTTEKAKQRADGSKDFWAIAVVMIRTNNARQEFILLDGEASKDWSKDQGLDVACRLMTKWRTNLFFNESVGGFIDDYTESMRAAGRRNGVNVRMDEQTKKLLKFKSIHGAQAKNTRITNLCDYSRDGRFFILKRCNEKFLVGDGEYSGFLTQIRKFRPLASGRNNLRHDDHIDATSRLTDSALQRYAPQPMMVDFGAAEQSDLESYRRRFRYCGA
jgi:hypothetical protein